MSVNLTCVDETSKVFHFVLIVGYVTYNVPIEFRFVNCNQIQGKLYTLVHNISIKVFPNKWINGRLCGSNLNEQVVRVLVVNIDGTRYFVPTESKVNTEVGLYSCLPLQSWVCKSNRTQTTTVNVTTIVYIPVAETLALLVQVVRNFLVTSNTITQTKAEVIEEFWCEIFFSNPPFEGKRWEVTVFIVTTKFGRAIGTQSGSEQVFAHNAKVQTTKVGL